MKSVSCSISVYIESMNSVAIEFIHYIVILFHQEKKLRLLQCMRCYCTILKLTLCAVTHFATLVFVTSSKTRTVNCSKQPKIAQTYICRL